MSEMMFRRAPVDYPEIEIKPARVFFGLHTIRVCVLLRDKKIVWPSRFMKTYKLRRGIGDDHEHDDHPLNCRPKSQQCHEGQLLSFKRFSIPQVLMDDNGHMKKGSSIRLCLQRGGYLLLTFEPMGFFPDACTDLLPLSQWSDAWERTMDLVSKELHCPRLFSNETTTINRLDCAFDLFYDPVLLLRSCGYLRNFTQDSVDNRSLEKKNMKSRTTFGGKESDKYSRTDKANGKECLRFEYRFQSRGMVRSNLGLRHVQKSVYPYNLLDHALLRGWFDRTMKRNSIFPQTKIIPWFMAVNIAKGRSLELAVKDFPLWEEQGEGAKWTKRLREKHHVTIGSVHTTNVVVVKGLYEAFQAAFERSWSD
jgi:hypothetical protein